MSIITVPFSWLLLKLYEPVQNFGLALILFALVVRLVMLPFQLKSKRSMMRMTSLQPVLKELEKKHGGNKQKYQAEVAKLYQEEKINPMSGCLWSLIPFPILIALYSVVRQPLTHVMGLTADQVSTVAELISSYGVELSGGAYQELEIARHISEHFDELHAAVPQLIDLNYNFLGMNLCDFPQLNFFSQVDWSDASDWGPALGLFLIPFISAFLSWLTMKISSSSQNVSPEQAGTMKTMNIIMPLISVYICFVMPAAMGIYWIAGSVFSIFQELVVNRHYKKILDAEAAERNARYAARAAEEERRREAAAKRRQEGEILKNKNTSKRKLEAKSRTQEADRRAAERAASRPAQEQPTSQVGARRYARGRAYDPARYGDEVQPEAAEIEETPAANAAAPADESVPVAEVPEAGEAAGAAETPVPDVGDSGTDAPLSDDK